MNCSPHFQSFVLVEVQGPCTTMTVPSAISPTCQRVRTATKKNTFGYQTIFFRIEKMVAVHLRRSVSVGPQRPRCHILEAGPTCHKSKTSKDRLPKFFNANMETLCQHWQMPWFALIFRLFGPGFDPQFLTKNGILSILAGQSAAPSRSRKSSGCRSFKTKTNPATRVSPCQQDMDFLRFWLTKNHRFWLTRPVQQDVGGLQISVHDPLRMQMRQATQQLPEETFHLSHGEVLLGDQHLQPGPKKVTLQGETHEAVCIEMS